MRIDRKLLVALGLVSLTTSACGKFSLNEMLVTKAQQESVDSLVQEAQYEYDKGRLDNALSLTDRALAISPNSESPTILKGYVYLSKAGLDGINISKKLIDSNEATKANAAAATASGTVKTGDTTTDNFNVLKTVLNLSAEDFADMGNSAQIGDPALTIYFPKSATDARDSGSNTLDYLNLAISTLCPLIESNANPDGDVDTRHTCTKNPNVSTQIGRSNFAWALAHLGEAISFYSLILYDSDGDGIPNLQEALPKEQLTTENASTFLATINTLNTAVNAIFPTDPVAAANSMLNSLFFDLETTSTALSSIPGIPTEVSDSVKKSIDDLNTKIAAINSGTSAASAQNEALKNSLTTGVAKTLQSKIESSAFTDLTPTQQQQGCCVYRNLNATAARPSTCSELTYNATFCDAALAQ